MPQNKELIRGFIHGVKDCILIDNEREASSLLGRFPSVSYHRNLGNRAISDYWFFRDDDIKKQIR